MNSTARTDWNSLVCTNLTADEKPIEGWETHPNHLYCPTVVELDGGVLVEKVPVCGSMDAYYSAWEPVQGSILDCSHSTITHFGHVLYGKVSSRRLPADRDLGAPGSDERIAAVNAWYKEQYRVSHELVRRAFPGREFRDAGIGELSAPLA